MYCIKLSLKFHSLNIICFRPLHQDEIKEKILKIPYCIEHILISNV